MPNKDKILIVEDDFHMVKHLKYKMKHMGYNVVGHAASGKDAIDLATKLHPDLVLMDILLEGAIDGIEAAQKIRETCNIPVVYLTAQEDELQFQRAKIT